LKVCVVQTGASPGEIPCNLQGHLKLISLAAEHGSDVVVFPELSATGYEPSLAAKLACGPDDARFDVIEAMSREHEMVIGIGVPLKCSAGVQIGMVIFQSGHPRRVYSKAFIHADEEPFFVAGCESPDLILRDLRIAPAICYEISLPEHAARARQRGADVYLASVAKDNAGIARALKRLGDVAKGHGMVVLMSNCVGTCDGDIGAGRTSAWDGGGALLAQLNGRDEGILIYDTDTGDVVNVVVTTC
jgi:predicted amidohydrolase